MFVAGLTKFHDAIVAMSDRREHPWKNALVCGASRGIGLAVVRNLLARPSIQKCLVTCRSTSDQTALRDLSEQYPGRLVIVGLDIDRQSEYKKLLATVKAEVSTLDICINSIGLLHEAGLEPERRIEDVDQQALSRLLQVNMMPCIFLFQQLKTLFRHSPEPVFATISAKVGSITDNRMGGWYSYRISKAALNMAIKNIAIEWARAQKRSLCVALHPGTTDTTLSQPFLASASKRYEIHTPEQTAQNLLQVLERLRPGKDTGRFFSYSGAELPW